MQWGKRHFHAQPAAASLLFGHASVGLNWLYRALGTQLQSVLVHHSYKGPTKLCCGSDQLNSLVGKETQASSLQYLLVASLAHCQTSNVRPEWVLKHYASMFTSV